MRISLLFLLLTLALVAGEPSYQYRWKAHPDESRVAAIISPFMYGKRWAYSIEFDDGGSFPAHYAADLLAGHSYTNAPAGENGGRTFPFVGTCAINPFTIDTGNRTSLSWAEISKLRERGWGFVNHSYWHTGVHWDQKKRNSPDQFRRELFWSQAVLGKRLFNNQHGSPELVFPNGDYNYRPYLKEFNIRYGVHCHGKSRNINGDFDFLSITRSLMDDHGWRKKKYDTLDSFPTPRPKDGDIFIDFTHRIQKPGSENYQAWQKRLQTIEKLYGAKGDNSLWCAPSVDVLNYFTASKAAKLRVKAGRFRVDLPKTAVGSALTIVLKGLHPKSKLPVPEGGNVFRKGNRAWVTTPCIGVPGVSLPQPRVDIAYEGMAKRQITFDKPITFAALRFLVMGNIPKDYKLSITLTKTDGSRSPLDLSKVHRWVPFKTRWGAWYLYPTIPDVDAPSITAVEMPLCKSIKKMQVWKVLEPPR